jgi:hypothetical protein
MWECVCFIFMYYTIDYKIINYYFLFLFLVCVYIMHILCILCILYVLYMLYVWCKCLYWLSPCLYRSFQHYLEGQYNWEPPSEKLRKKTRIKVLSVVENYIFEKYGVFTPLGASTKFPKMLTHGEVRMDCGYPRVSHPLYHIGYRGMRALGRIPPHTRRLRIVGLVVRR